jgi:hypothetical protein
MGGRPTGLRARCGDGRGAGSEGTCVKKRGRRLHGPGKPVQFMIEPRQGRENLGVRLDTMPVKKSDPIGNTGCHQIGDKRVRIHDYALTVYAA